MSFGAIYLWLTALVPLLALPLSMWRGARLTLLVVLVIALCALSAPFVFYGFWGLWEGASLTATFTLLRPTIEPLLVIMGAMVLWSCIATAAGVALRACITWFIARRRAA